MLQEYNFQSSRDSAARVRLKHTGSSYSPGPKSHRRSSASLKETDEGQSFNWNGWSVSRFKAADGEMKKK